jgi:hypothetical protein
VFGIDPSAPSFRDSAPACRAKVLEIELRDPFDTIVEQ